MPCPAFSSMKLSEYKNVHAYQLHREIARYKYGNRMSTREPPKLKYGLNITSQVDSEKVTDDKEQSCRSIY